MYVNHVKRAGTFESIVYHVLYPAACKYFLNLEKRNHVKKDVRKLHISGAISSDPSTIMDSHGKYYKNLHCSRSANLDNVESSIFFDSPNLPSISYESRIIIM